MVYREKETERLQQAYRMMQQTGDLQLRFICGEAGSGKTVLANMFVDSVSENAERTLFVSTYCGIRSEYNIPYQPFKELLKQLLLDVDEQTEAEKKEKSKLKESLAFCGKMLLEYAPDLIGNFIPGASVLGAIGQSVFKEKREEQKPAGVIEENKILEQYVDAIEAIASKYKLVFLLDNLQWIDPSSVNLLYQMITRLRRNAVFIIGCYRSNDVEVDVRGEKHPMNKLITEVKIAHGNVFINLDLIPETERKELMNKMLDTDTNMYDQYFREKLFEHTNGNPLFVSELTGLLKEESMIVRNNDGVWMNNSNLQWKSYPVRIEGIVQERIGQLEDSLVEILSHASVQGYSFIAQVLSKTMGESERNLLVTLSKTLQKQHRLVFEGDCFRSSQGMVSRFNFSNYIFQQYLYQELSVAQRMMLHSDTAAILEDLFKDHIDEVAGDIARHYEMSGEHEKAIQYIDITAKQMMRTGSYAEASALLQKALQFLGQLPETPDNEKTRLAFMLHLCVCAMSTKGWGNPEVEELYEKTKELCKKRKEFDHIEIVLFGLWLIKLSKLQLDECLQQSFKNMTIAIRHSNTSVKLMSLISMGSSFFWMGDIEKAEESFAHFFSELKQLSDWEKDENCKLNYLYGLMFKMLIDQQKQDDGKAIETRKTILEILSQSPNSYHQVVAHCAIAWYSYFAGDMAALRAHADEMIEKSTVRRFQSYNNMGKIFKGATLIGADNETAEELIFQAYRGMLDFSQANVALMHSVYVHILALCYREQGRREQADSFIETEIARCEQIGERVYIPALKQLQLSLNK
jgi:predicted ATPase